MILLEIAYLLRAIVHETGHWLVYVMAEPLLTGHRSRAPELVQLLIQSWYLCTLRVDIVPPTPQARTAWTVAVFFLYLAGGLLEALYWLVLSRRTPPIGSYKRFVYVAASGAWTYGLCEAFVAIVVYSPVGRAMYALVVGSLRLVGLAIDILCISLLLFLLVTTIFRVPQIEECLHPERIVAIPFCIWPTKHPEVVGVFLRRVSASHLNRLTPLVVSEPSSLEDPLPYTNPTEFLPH